MATRVKIIGITLGDINGIGPEVAVAAARRPDWPAACRLVLIGDAGVIQSLQPGLPDWQPGRPAPSTTLSYWDPQATPPLTRTPGRVSVRAARAAHAWILRAVDEAAAGRLDALVTAPIQKEGFMKAGIDAPGHTELIASHLGVAQVEMMLLSGHFRVVLATRHVPLRHVAQQLTVEKLAATFHCTADMLEWLGARQRRIAVCGLNPHAGDGGAIGREEIEVVRPAMRRVRRTDCTLIGPVPADTVFYQVRHHAYDAVVAMYHDQALAPFKMVAFESGVNLTGGLPIVRTSPDHGTAYDRAGQGTANPSSMRAAIRLAYRLAGRTNPWRDA